MAQDSLDYSKTYIAFDSGCGECSAISHSLEQETNGKLLARPLSDPEVEQIRYPKGILRPAACCSHGPPLWPDYVPSVGPNYRSSPQ